jgi:hypothetical protein
MSYAQALGVVPDRRPIVLAEFHNSHGLSPSIWKRLLTHHDMNVDWFRDDGDLTRLWNMIETLPGWQQAALVLTFDTGVIPHQAFGWAVDGLDEFEARLPSPEGHVNHVPAIAALLRTGPEVPLFGMWGTSVSDNPFDPWDDEADDEGSGIPLSAMYVLERHRGLVAYRR